MVESDISSIKYGVSITNYILSKYSLIVRLTFLTSLNIKFTFFFCVIPRIIGRYLQKFRMTVLPPYSGAKIYKTEACHAHIIICLLVKCNYQEL